jgi:adenylate kinase
MEVNTFLMIGRPASGKGTQAKLLAQKIGAEVYSTGERCREFAAVETYFGKKTKEIIEKGDLMPEWFSIYLFEDKLIELEPESKIIMEGSGRKMLEAKRYHDVMEWLVRPYRVVYLDAPEAELRERIAQRLTTEGRADDAFKALDLRFERFRENTLPAVEFFRSKGVLIEVNAQPPIEEVHQEILKVLGLS